MTISRRTAADFARLGRLPLDTINLTFFVVRAPVPGEVPITRPFGTEFEYRRVTVAARVHPLAVRRRLATASERPLTLGTVHAGVVVGGTTGSCGNGDGVGSSVVVVGGGNVGTTGVPS